MIKLKIFLSLKNEFTINGLLEDLITDVTHGFLLSHITKMITDEF